MEKRIIRALGSVTVLAAQLLAPYEPYALTATSAGPDCASHLRRAGARVESGFLACAKKATRMEARGKPFDLVGCKGRHITRFESRIAKVGCAPDPDRVEKAFPDRTGELARGFVTLNGTVREVDYEIIDGVAVFDGDIELGPIDQVEEGDGQYPAANLPVHDVNANTTAVALGSATSDAFRWPEATIPYEIDPDLEEQPVQVGDTYDHRISTSDLIEQAIAEWNSKTFIRLEPRAGQEHFVRFVTKSGGCSSNSIGRKGGKQYIMLASECLKGNIIHEIGHAAGLYHEQKRRDRTDFIQVIWSNIVDSKESQYHRYDPGDGVDRGAIDFGSIMMYGSFSDRHAVDDEQPVMVRQYDASGAVCATTVPAGAAEAAWRADCTWRGQREKGLSPGDISGVAGMVIDDATVRLWTHFGTGEGFEYQSTFEGTGFWGDNKRWLAGDFDGDGMDDLVNIDENSEGNARAWVQLATGAGFEYRSSIQTLAGFWDSQRWLAGDFDGDGKDDLVNVYGNAEGTARAWVHRSTGSGFEHQSSFTTFAGFWDAQRWLVGDFDGDGKDDLVNVYGNSEGTARAWVHRSTGSGFEYQSSFTSFAGFWDAQRWLVGDFDGDGKDDLVNVYGNSEGTARAWVHRSTGSGFEYQSSFTGFAGFWDEQRWLVGDFNRDGVGDLINVYEAP